MAAPAPPPDREAAAERWARIEAVFQAALSRPPEERARFLEDACGGDSSLVLEVESLVQSDAAASAQTFEHWPAMVAAARLRERRADAERQTSALIGQSLSHYDVVDRIGSGGMGDVYRATDRVLGRAVAIKILPRNVADDVHRLDRFRLEARAASMLTHPNVAAIYELGEDAGLPFIAMEYVQGRTLDELLGDGPMTFETVLDVARQITAALASAHEAGITHRDIKPANVMVTPRGVVKVLDFGLAKLGAASLAVVGEWDNATARMATTPGLVMGTIDYMSPEQALGEPVDHRSDLFSVGVLLYQLSTGALPFRRHSVTATLDAILHADPASPSSVRPGLAPAFDRVVARALAKSPSARYQSAGELAADLDALSRRNEPKGAPSPHGRLRASLPRMVAVAAVVGAAGAAAWQLRPRTEPPPMVVPFTSFAGMEATPAFAPGGERLAFSWDGPTRDNVDIYVKAMSGDPVRLTSNPASEQFPAFSPDGSLIAFVRDRSRVFVVPSQGGAEREVGAVTDPRIAFSPDGQFIAAGGPASPGTAGAGLILLPLSGGARRTLTAPPRGASDIAPAFSPDGSRLAFQRIPTAAVSDIWLADASGANATRITFDDRLLEGPVWTEDGQSLIFSSARLGAGRLWRVRATGGTPEALPDTGPGSTMPTVPRRGDRHAFVATLEDTNIWEIPIGPTSVAASPPRPSVSGSSWLDGSPDFSRDGTQLVFVSNRTGRDEIFIGSVDSVAARQLTDFSRVPASTVGSPRISPDGREVVFDARVRGNADIYVVSADGGTPRALTSDPGADVVPVWAPDGTWIYFTSRRGGPPQIWRVRRDGGAEEQVTSGGAFGAQFSADGQFLLYSRDRVNTSLWRRAVAGGSEEPALLDDRNQPRIVVQFAFWRPTRTGIIFLERRQPEAPGQAVRFLLQSYDAASRRIETLTTLSAPPALAAGGLAVSPDGRRVLYTQIDQQRSDINLLQPYR